MSAEVDNNPAPDEATEPKLLSWASLQAGLNDQLNLLGNPDPETFKPNPQFTLIRLIRLVVIVLGFTGALLGISLIVLEKKDVAGIIFQKAPAAVFVGGAIIAVSYTFVARIFGVQIGIRDAFFAILLVGLPWVSLTSAVYVMVGRFPVLAPFLVLWIFLMPVILLRNVCRALGMILPDCNKWRVRVSVVAPAFLLLAIVACVWLFRDQPEASTPPRANPAARVAN